MGCPTLLIAPAGSDIDAIAEATGLVRRFAGNEINRISAFLSEAMHGTITTSRKSERYSWTTIADTLDTVLRKVAGKLEKSDRSAAFAGRS
jgi:hypothetical protein